MIYFFDNCISKKIVEILRLAGADEGPHKLRHLQEIDDFAEGPNTPDVVWMPYVAERRWTAVTADIHITRKPHERKILSEIGLSAVFVMGSVVQAGRMEQARFFINHWPSIVKHTSRCGPAEHFKVNSGGKVETFR